MQGSDPRIEQRRSESAAARHKPWWKPFVLMGLALGFFGLLLAFFSPNGAVRALGRMAMAASALALLGVILTFFWWGRVIMGVKHHDRKWFPFVFSLRGWSQLLVISLAWGIGGGIFDYSVQPEFCQSCHLMVPYYRAWHESTHKGVICIECHFDPGLANEIKGKIRASSMLVKYLTKTYGSMPHAEISDASCMRSGCHSERLLQGKVAWKYTRDNGETVNLQFDHAPHLGDLRRGKQLRCTSCHSQVVQGEHIAVTLDTCYVCHFKGMKHGRDQEVIGGCKSCHGVPPNDIRLVTGTFNHKAYTDRGVTCENCHADAIRGDGEVHKQFCWNCHNRLEHVERFGEAAFIHKTHITDHKLRCTECHIRIDHRVNADTAMSGGSCVACHQTTHAGPAELYRGVGGRGVPDMPSPMFRAQVDCIGCHQMKEHGELEARVTGQTFIAVQDACNKCHGDDADPTTGKYATRLAEWKQVIEKRTAEVAQAVEAAEAALKDAKLDDVARLAQQRRMDDARYNLTFVKLGHGVHNYNYAIALLNVAASNAQQVSAACTAEKTQ